MKLLLMHLRLPTEAVVWMNIFSSLDLVSIIVGAVVKMLGGLNGIRFQ